MLLFFIHGVLQIGGRRLVLMRAIVDGSFAEANPPRRRRGRRAAKTVATSRRPVDPIHLHIVVVLGQDHHSSVIDRSMDVSCVSIAPADPLVAVRAIPKSPTEASSRTCIDER